MTSKPYDEFVFEPERYELRSPPAYYFDLDRREFFRVVGAGVAVALVCRSGLAGQEPGRGRRGSQESLPKEIGAWLHVGESGEVTVFTGKVEMGQNIRTSLAQAVAEELRVPVASIRLVMGDTDLTPFDMGTFGSRTTPTMSPQLRRVAAAARDLLVELAAKRWNAKPGKLKAEDGKISDPASGRSIEYKELATGQALAKAVIDDEPLTPPTEWKVTGKSLSKVNGADFVTGKHRYTPDLKGPEILHGKVLRPPSFGAALTSLGARAAEAMPGVTVVRDGNFVGVAAKSEPEATRAVAALKAEWKPVPQIPRRELFDYLKKNARPSEDRQETGSLASALSSADHRLEATYTVEYIAHAPLEPRAAVAEWRDGKLTVWTGTQRPFGVRDELVEAFRLPLDRVRVIMPDTGAGFGGKHTGDAAIEAARLAKAAGRPVKLVWTREEEFTWAYFRPAGVIEVRSGAHADGTLTAWEFHNYNSGGAGIRTPYEVGSQRIEFHPVDSPLRQGSYRALAATANHFARESHMDDVAHQLKMDPLEFRLKNLKDDRLRAVFQAAAKQIGWGGAKSSSGRGFGIGGGFEKGGYVATCAEVTLDRATGSVRVVRVVTAFDCGAVVNPDGLKNQIAGANVMGLGGALFEAIDFENGRVLNNLFSLYRVPRFSDVPPIEVVLVDRKDQPSAGAGETPLVGLAPAIGNAIFAATSIRLRSLPMLPEGKLPKVNPGA
ncbi:MAG: molybdopterin-dependent oxidoreductase [Acidobacteriia bacterium]|nr:molybdopterin-dependent oxidoreductase [Terriglobia bacterium]